MMQKKKRKKKRKKRKKKRKKRRRAMSMTSMKISSKTITMWLPRAIWKTRTKLVPVNLKLTTKTTKII